MSEVNLNQFDGDNLDTALFGGFLQQIAVVPAAGSNASNRTETASRSSDGNGGSFVSQQDLLQSISPTTIPFLPNVSSATAMTAVSSMNQNTTDRSSSNGRSRRKKRGLETIQAVSENESEMERRRQDRNQREQQRSQQVSMQISALKEILEAADVNFKPDRYSTLINTAKYIKRLQDRSKLLDQEHKKLLDTIQQTSDIVNNMQAPSASSESDMGADEVSSRGMLEYDSQNVLPSEDVEEKGFVSDLDFKSIFAVCPVACSITRVDGRFLECNKEFEDLTGFSRREMLPMEDAATVGVSRSEQEQSTVTSEFSDGALRPSRNLSIFNVFNSDDMRRVFDAMSLMLKSTVKDAESSEELWSGSVRLSRNQKFPEDEVTLVVRLARGDTGRPRFFSCCLLPRSNAEALVTTEELQKLLW